MIVDRCLLNYELSEVSRAALPNGCLSGYEVVLGGARIGYVWWYADKPEWLATRLDGSSVSGKGHMQACGSDTTQRAAVAMLVEALAKKGV